MLYQWRLVQAIKFRVYRFLRVEEGDLRTDSEAEMFVGVDDE